MGTVTFRVDAALLRELGERLVGKPHVALAELIKNAYDADATVVELRVQPHQIVVTDDGHGMNLDAFRDYWMRIGSPHKQNQRVSPNGRPLTGQKGVGRLAVQLLGRSLALITKSAEDAKALSTSVDWDKAVKKGELTSVELEYDRVDGTGEFPGGATHGTRLTITNLSQPWTVAELKDLALEIWALQPPFEAGDETAAFRVTIVDAPEELRKTFALYMQAFRALWHARIIGKLTPPRNPGGKGQCEVTVLFDDKAKEHYVHAIESCPLHGLEFDVAVYSLTGKQPHGVTVGDLREYLQRFGGVGIYDGGFRLPYYGVDTDWLRVQLDHSRRLTNSELLPDAYKVERGLQFLPTNSRILGTVRVNTGEERRWVGPRETRGMRPLEIAISRDRLIENEAFEVLRRIVRAALDFYAMREATRELKRAESKRKIDRAGSAVQRIADIVERHSEALPKAAVAEIKATVKEATAAVEIERDVQSKQANLLGALATAGIAAAAFEHESARQLRRLEELAGRLAKLAERAGPVREELRVAAEQIRTWIEDTRATRQLFSAIADPENREQRHRLKVRTVVEQVIARLGPLMRGVPVDLSALAPDIRLPSGTFVEWSALFQNVLVNAMNATLDSDERRIAVVNRNEGVARVILVQDTGVGVDVESSVELFEPFVRRLKLSPAKQGLGVGGSGLGLAIVRMIATNLGCRVSFTAPDKHYATAFRLAWSERS